MARSEAARLNEISGNIVRAAVQVHSVLGPGLLESAYEACLACELRERRLVVRTQVALPLIYKDINLEGGYRIDLLVEESVIAEIKTVTKVLPVHEAQLLTHLRLSGHRLGLLLNFYVPRMRDGIKRMVNNL
jgi:GxxExxY protein